MSRRAVLFLSGALLLFALGCDADTASGTDTAGGADVARLLALVRPASWAAADGRHYIVCPVPDASTETLTTTRRRTSAPEWSSPAAAWRTPTRTSAPRPSRSRKGSSTWPRSRWTAF